MPRQVIVAPRAEAQMQTIDRWWRRNRLDSPDLFADELAEAFSTLEVAPETGSRYLQSQLEGVRRIRLPATRHHIYYLTGANVVVVLAVWGSVKGSGPDLRGVR